MTIRQRIRLEIIQEVILFLNSMEGKCGKRPGSEVRKSVIQEVIWLLRSQSILISIDELRSHLELEKVLSEKM